MVARTFMPRRSRQYGGRIVSPTYTPSAPRAFHLTTRLRSNGAYRPFIGGRGRMLWEDSVSLLVRHRLALTTPHYADDSPAAAGDGSQARFPKRLAGSGRPT